MSSTVRFFSAATYPRVETIIDDYRRQNPNWEIVSISHALIPNAVSVACVLKYIGNNLQEVDSEAQRGIIDEK